MNPLISIIVPIFNTEKYLIECIESIRNQSYKNIQIILVNDGSTDKSLEICNLFAKNDSRIIVVNQQNSGVSSARNNGINISTGEYISFIDSDDYVNKNMIEHLYNTLVNNNTEICVLMNYTIKPIKSMRKYGTRLTKCEAIRELFLLRFPSSLWAYLYKRDVLCDVRLNNKIHFFEDFEFNFRALTKVENVALSFENYYYYRSHEISTNNQAINYKRMTCLHIYELCAENINKSDCKINSHSLFFQSHFLISVIFSILKSNTINDEFTDISKTKSRELLTKIIFSIFVPLSYKISIFLFVFSPKLLKILLNKRKFINEN